MGLASQLVDGDVVAAALKLAGLIASKGPVAVRLAKRAIHENADVGLAAAMAAERSLFGLCFATADQKEGMAAFLEKRKPDYRGE
jgi:enoyl-CoA hydratase